MAAWKNPSGGSGHVAVARPESAVGAIVTAQAGAVNYKSGPISRGFGRLPYKLFCNTR